MPFDVTALAEPNRVAAVDRARLTLAGLSVPLDGLAALAAKLLDAPFGAVCLVGGDADTIIGSYGLAAQLGRGRRIALEYSLGKHVVASDGATVIPDMAADSDLADHRQLTEHGVRAFVGAPLHGPAGEPVGSIIVADNKPRQWSARQVAQLEMVAEVLRPTAPRTPAGALPDLELGPLLESVLEAFVAIDIDGALVGMNPAAEALFGRTAAEAVGQPISDLLTLEGDAARQRALFAEMATTDRPQHRALATGRAVDGREFSLDAYLTCVPSRSGPLICGFLIDTSEQAEVRRYAARQGSFLNAVLDSVLTGIVACDPNGMVVVANRPLREWYRLPDDWQPFDLGAASTVAYELDGTAVPAAETPLFRALHGAVVQGQHLQIKPPGRQSRTFLLNAQPVRDGGGQLLGAVAALHDVTDQMRTDRFRACELEVVRTLAYAKSPTDAIAAVLHAMAATLRWSWGEAWLLAAPGGRLQPAARWLADDPDDSCRRDVRWQGEALARQCLESGQAVWLGPTDVGATPVRPPGGALEPRHRLAVPIRSDGAELGALALSGDEADGPAEHYVGFAQAMAAHLAAFLARHRAQELRAELDRSKDDYVALVGHAVRTPLTAIGAYSELLRDSAVSWPEDDRSMLEAITRNAETLRAIIEDLLDLAAIESGHANLQLVDTDLAPLAREVMAAQAASAAANNVTVVDRVPDRLPLHADQTRLRQVVENLLSNAIKYSPEGGEVKVYASSHDDVAELTITDAGVGVPTEEREQLFRRFFRASNVINRGIPGTGLGLALVRAVVEMHGGDLIVAPVPGSGAGTVATARLPLTPSPGDPSPGPS
ncbi:ATP-binding protein [Pilimelia columellifera]|uniref:histidine kinase n=1 Tax=Pilimelia columellifera subsp. columellifera TaxID=706583 RepID=A0ABP6AS76_9ACTN